ncbi:AGZA family xanthine/uracil permease-like MFS transporter [Tamaricihabitans halophyticus]|uniref:AGZA family xanthine/uracil permease-like MFS transporter n=1 Tax=Tamaricihabitans halophyticus TaxID=1262583 RepID=A0A4R2R2H2_9PSEU|nr:NCS2 family permease [Tamaricihabitans halophyticus]TCP56940.1 AGZA family xanthine/uracil permease-like MFS transporter [Tamaricihabitans halophyticus]
MSTTEARRSQRGSLADRWFQISARGSTPGREVRGGITNFVAIAYIVVLNPLILSGATDVNGERLSLAGLTTMTALSAGLMSLLMGIVGRAPLAMAAGLSVNAVVAYQVAPQVTWPQAMGLVVVEGLLILLLAASGIRTMIVNAIPRSLKLAIGVGIGMFVALIGLVHAGFVSRRPDAADTDVPVQLGEGGRLVGWPIVIFAFGLILMFALYSRRTPGAILTSILGATVLAVVVEAIWHPGGWGLVTPTLPDQVVALPDFSLFGRIDIIGALTTIPLVTLLVFVFTLVLSGFFDAIGAVLGVGEEAGLVNEDGRMPTLGRIMVVDGIAAAFGGVTSSSANTVFVESAAGVKEGARTGLASVVTGGLFLVVMFMAPLAAVIPQAAASPALVLVGGLMAMQCRNIDWSDVEIALPAFLVIAIPAFTYSVTTGVGAGVLAYTVIKAARGKWREPGWLIWSLSVVFLAYFAIDGLERLAS